MFRDVLVKTEAISPLWEGFEMKTGQHELSGREIDEMDALSFQARNGIPHDRTRLKDLSERHARLRPADVGLLASLRTFVAEHARGVQHEIEDAILLIALAADAIEALEQADGECDLCAGECRGHGLGLPEEWKPELGSRAYEAEGAVEALKAAQIALRHTVPVFPDVERKVTAALAKASGMEAATAGETRTSSTEGDSPTAEDGDAQKGPA